MLVIYVLLMRNSRIVHTTQIKRRPESQLQMYFRS